MSTATFRFYAELNYFLPPHRRFRAFDAQCPRGASVKHMIEALGVPHTEVEVVLVNGASAGFDARVRDGDRVAVYPMFEALDVTPLLRLRERPLRETRFIADAHLGGLARRLRMLGFDTLYQNAWRDDEIERIAAAQGRIVLTRDRALLLRRAITHGCYVHRLRPDEQVREIVDRLDLARSAQPFSRCLHCNAPLEAASVEEVADRLPPRVRECFQRFQRCPSCRRTYWEGSHWQRMKTLVDVLMPRG